MIRCRLYSIGILLCFSLCIRAQVSWSSCSQSTTTVLKIFYANTTDSVVMGTQAEGMYLCGPNTIVYDTTYYEPVFPGCRIAFLNPGTELVIGASTCPGPNFFYVKNNATLRVTSSANAIYTNIYYEPSAIIIGPIGSAQTFSCSSISFPIVNCFTGIKELERNNEIFIYPMPSSTILNISVDKNELRNSKMEITNFLGQTVLKSEFKNQIDVSNLAIGFYTLLLKDNSGNVITKKFVKE